MCGWFQSKGRRATNQPRPSGGQISRPTGGHALAVRRLIARTPERAIEAHKLQQTQMGAGKQESRREEKQNSRTAEEQKSRRVDMPRNAWTSPR
jgi:hypothetical protein